MKISLHALNAARRNLTNFWIGTAARYHRVYGIGYREVEGLAQEFSLDAMVALRTACMAAAEPFPVLEGFSDKTIFTNKEGNWAFRFMHDMEHIAQKKGFGYQEERDVAHMHVRDVRDVFGLNSIESALTVADTFGSLLYFAEYKDHPKDQLGYALQYLDCYLDEFPRQDIHMMSPAAKDTTYFYDCADFIRAQ